MDDSEGGAADIAVATSSPLELKDLIIESEKDGTDVEHTVFESSTDLNHECLDGDETAVREAITARSVSFSSIEVREYPLCIGDNPGCKRGVPIAIDWEYNQESRFSVDDYEEAAAPGRVVKIPPPQRFKMLQKTEMYSRNEIMKQLKRVEADRQRRQITRQFLKSQPIEEYVEGVKRAVLNATVRRNSKRREREFLQPFVVEHSEYESACEKKDSRSLYTSSSSVGSAGSEDDLSSNSSDELLHPTENESVVFTTSEDLVVGNL
eukprot:scaffold25535_cov117-Cylindrotheca_fusiformis.AAC.4